MKVTETPKTWTTQRARETQTSPACLTTAAVSAVMSE